ncbi:MAG: tRNA-dihydrouridine synthase, partial [Planctomycetota bacterium]
KWTFLRDLRARYNDRPILGSGDIWSAQDIFRMLAYTGISGVSVARGCIGNPWVFRQARQMMAAEEATTPTIEEQQQALRAHFELSVAVNGERTASLMMRKFGIRFATHHPDAEIVRKRFIAVKSLDDWHTVLDEYYNTEESRIRIGAHEH